MASTKAIRDRYLAALNDKLGWDAKIGSDQHVDFESGCGYRLYLVDYPDDPEYFQMVASFELTSFLRHGDERADVNSPEAQKRLQSAATTLTNRVKGLKVIPDLEQGVIAFTIECFVAGQDQLPEISHLASIAPRMRSIIDQGIKDMGNECLSPNHEIDLSAWEGEFADRPPSAD